MGEFLPKVEPGQQSKSTMGGKDKMNVTHYYTQSANAKQQILKEQHNQWNSGVPGQKF